MAVTKHPFGRYMIIDRELGRKEWVKTKELKQVIEEELSINVSLRMINEDIAAMRDDSLLKYFAPIEWDKKRKAYFYTDRDFTISAFNLKEADITALMFYAKTLNLYKNYDVFKDFSNSIDKVLNAVKIRKNLKEGSKVRTIVQTEKGHSDKGNEYISNLIEALEENREIEIEYKKFGNDNTFKQSVQPYFLKEDKFRWYLLAKPVNKDQLRVYGLDRMEGLRVSEVKFVPDAFNPDEYFKYSFGVTVTEEEPIEVIVTMDAYQGNFVKTLPLHETQEVLINNETEFRVSIKVKPSFEFYAKILSYGACLQIISPPEIVDEVRDRLQKALALYN